VKGWPEAIVAASSGRRCVRYRQAGVLSDRAAQDGAADQQLPSDERVAGRARRMAATQRTDAAAVELDLDPHPP
jgi:hypothetical protein